MCQTGGLWLHNNANVLRDHNYKHLPSEVTYVAWKHIPDTYLFCEEDEVVVGKPKVSGYGSDCPIPN